MMTTPTPTQPTIIIDTREQRAYEYAYETDGVYTTRGTLATGDYSIVGAADLIAIERKSVDDWVSTITHARERFDAELKRLRALDRAYIIIEASWADLYDGKYARSLTNPPAAVVARTLGIMSRYHVPVVMAGDRITARVVVKDVLLDYWRYRLPVVRERLAARAMEVEA